MQSSNAGKPIAVKQTDGFMAIAQAVKTEIIQTAFGRMPTALVAISRTDFPILEQKIFASLTYAVTAGKAQRVSRESEIAKTSEASDVIDD
jgi:hypothetical protein